MAGNDGHVVTGIAGSGAVAAALMLGFRHGFDWDHIAAITDLTTSQQSRRRALKLATLYVVGHAAVVLVLGLISILFAEQIPDSVDAAMERVVGVSLIVLGGYLAWTAATRPGALPVRSRWMLVLSGVRRVVGAGRGHDLAESVVITHSHGHDHRSTSHGHEHAEPLDGSGDGAVGEASAVADVQVAVAHVHAHAHSARLPSDPFVSYGSWSSLGVGMLHGVSAETPTQLAVFVTAASAGGTLMSAAMLGSFIVGIGVANTLVAAASIYGWGGLSRRPTLIRSISLVMAGLSLTVGALLLFGQASSLPSLLGS
ncbi:MAG TPA: hypothetical protein VMY34_10340 [Acidimicrobiales bacterium]|nr:hypothetical protein [Acidimicrobiales bacterium]